MDSSGTNSDQRASSAAARKTGLAALLFYASRWQHRIGVRLSASFALLLGLLLVLAAIAQLRFGALSDEFKQLIDLRLQNLALAAQVGDQANLTSRKLSFLFSADKPMRQPAYAEIAEANRQLDQGMAALETRMRSPQGQVRYKALAARLADYRRAYDATVERLEADDLQGARRLMVEDTDDTLSKLSRSVEELINTEQAKTLASTTSLDGLVRTDRKLILALCVAGVALGGFFLVIVTQRIVRPLARTEAAAKRLAKGAYDTRVEVLAQDEVGRVAAALNTLATAVGEREDQLLRMANTDALTGLPQRGRFLDAGTATLEGITQAGGHAALLCFDIDRLKTINAVLGFDAGDAVIIDAAKRLAAVFGPRANLSRLGGGTFAALVPVEDAADASRFAETLRREIEHKVAWGGQGLDLAITAGLALFPNHAGQVEPLLRRAEQALFEAKRLRVGCVHYTPELEASRTSHLSLLSDLQAAIEGGQLRQFLQPKLSPTGEVHGVEALVRWCHPQRGWVPPSEFVPFAESTGRIRGLTDWMLEEACKTLANWQRAGIPLTIAVNVSTRDIQDKSLAGRIKTLLDRYAIRPGQLQIELTESGLMESGQDPIQLLESLRALGIWLAIDDFGTGQSSLAYLQRLPINELKIDRSFVTDADLDPRRGELLGSIVKLGHSLGLRVTGEGAETDAELDVLGEVGCDLVQGYVFAKPMAREAFETWYDRFAAEEPRVATVPEPLETL